jgi:hypothetical protein
MTGKNDPVDWFFAFKFNTASYPKCDNAPATGKDCQFGGAVQAYKSAGQQYVVASSKHPQLVKLNNCIGATDNDPLGLTFEQVYTTDHYNYVVWNDQMTKNESVSSNKAHSKGMLVWDSQGDGFALQVSTPYWPRSGSHLHPRTEGNTLGCVSDDDNLIVSQHFFCVKLNKDDLVKVLNACINANVNTDITDQRLVKNGGPQEIKDLVDKLGSDTKSTEIYTATLSSGIIIISKPHKIASPPWQLVSATLDGVSLRVASWWHEHKICNTEATTSIACWPTTLRKPGRIEIATSGTWDHKEIGLLGGNAKAGNHAKIGVTINSDKHYSIFGDMNQEGTLTDTGPKKCNVAQNIRGGMFYVVDNDELFKSVSDLLKGEKGKTATSKDCSKK